MKPEYINLSTLDLIAAAGLILVNIGLSAILRLGMGTRLLVASVRMAVQLLLVGMILEWIFSLNRPLPVLAMSLLMATLAGVAAVRRTDRRFPGIYWNSLVTILATSFLVTGIGVIGIVGVRPIYDPQYVIPMLGMVLGNTLNGISLGLERLMANLIEHRALVETRLALGATRWEAARREVREALRTGLIPITNSMMVMGVVSLPGMMTGQILAGADPVDAVRYQIVIVFMIAAGTALGTLGIVLQGWGRLFSPRHQLLSKHIYRADGG